MLVKLSMSDIIKLLNGKRVYQESEIDPTVTLELEREDTSISKDGALERIDNEWDLVLKSDYFSDTDYPRKGLIGHFYTDLGPLGYIKTDDGIYYVSSRDPLAGKLILGQTVLFTGDNPGDSRNVAKDIKILYGIKSPYLVHCIKDEEFGSCGRSSYLTQEQYNAQMKDPDRGWCCPHCMVYPCNFDNRNYEDNHDPFK